MSSSSSSSTAAATAAVSSTGGRAAVKADGTEFRDLLKGRIDIIDYINQSVESPADLSSLSVVDGALVATPITNNSSHHPPSTSTAGSSSSQQPHCSSTDAPPALLLKPPPPRDPSRSSHRHTPTASSTSSTSSAGSSSGGQAYQQTSPNINSSPTGGQQQQVEVRDNNNSKPSSRLNSLERNQRRKSLNMYGMNQTRLPDSPPETDSAGVSAGSPSSTSENSPYSPDFGTFPPSMHPQGSVIHPPVGGHPQHPQQGVILGVHNMNNGGSALSHHQQLINELMPQQQQQQQNGNPFLGNPHHGPRAVVHHLNNGGVAPGGHLASPQGDFASPPHSQPTYAPPPPQVSPPTGVHPPQSPFMMQPQQQRGPPPAHIGAGMPQSPVVVTHQQAGTIDMYGGGGEMPPTRKRLRSDNGPVKPEPTSPTGDDWLDMEGYGGPHQQSIRFSEFNRDTWHSLCDPTGREQPRVGFNVLADKGFNYSHFDQAFVNQKKNHFQITVHIEAVDHFPSVYVKIGKELKPIHLFKLNFFGAKSEMTSTEIVIKQSTTDRKPIAYEPVELELPPMKVTTVTVPRLHFSETTMNNQRKNGRPNPDQKYFNLCVRLDAFVSPTESYTVVAFASEKVIVRASNPGQFDNGDSDVHWQKCSGGQQGVYHPGPVCVGTDRPQGIGLTVGGDISYTGNLFHPSDRRLKENINEIDPSDALSRLSKIRIVSYSIRPEIADKWGLTEAERERVGVIAQEIEEILPDAIKEDGEYLQVDDQRIAYETVGAVKELCRLTGNLDYKIAEVEKISEKLKRYCQLKRLGSMRSTMSLAPPSDSSSGVIGMGSYFSCSRASLASSRKGPDENHNKERHQDGEDTSHSRSKVRQSGHIKRRDTPPEHYRTCNHTCRYEQGLCSNKIIQATIVILVIVMAFCLVAMSTLYVIDWVNRNKDPPIHRQIVPAIPPPPPTSSNSTNAPKTKGDIRDIRPTTPKPVDDVQWQSPNWGRRPPPLLAQCQRQKASECRHYCCNYAHDTAPNENIHANVQASYASKQQIDIKRRMKRGVPRMNSNGGVESATPSEVRIKIPRYNVTLDQRYCLSGFCELDDSSYQYFVPVSIAMPLQSLPLEFELLEGQRASWCNLDGKGGPAAKSFAICARDGEQLSNKPDPNVFNALGVVQKGENVFELPVGNYLRSSYTFRISHSSDVCKSSADERGKTFDEFTITFYRHCQQTMEA